MPVSLGEQARSNDFLSLSGSKASKPKPSFRRPISRLNSSTPSDHSLSGLHLRTATDVAHFQNLWEKVGEGRPMDPLGHFDPSIPLRLAPRSNISEFGVDSRVREAAVNGLRDPSILSRTRMEPSFWESSDGGRYFDMDMPNRADSKMVERSPGQLTLRSTSSCGIPLVIPNGSGAEGEGVD